VEGLLRVDAAVGELQKKKLAELRAKRDNVAVKAALAALETAAKTEETNLLPVIVTAVKTYATLGEICGVLRGVFGEYKATVSL
jgi:methylmalonyl-CoA mutase N-terminal domain/subunit